jgi:aminoglycoside phosphotransferase (APT) family kinase protein
MYWQEQTGEVIGAPFYLMEKMEGRVPADSPSYNAEGWMTELQPADREAMWQSYLETLVRIHQLDPAELGLGFLAKPELGATPIEQELSYYESYYRWAFGDRKHPQVERSLPWLRANRPAGPEPVALCWGDARVGNIIFHQNRCAAVIDWEMARLGNPVMDLSWGLFFDRFHTEGYGVERLEGIPDRESTIAIYEGLSGEKAENIEYYELLGGMKFSVIIIRIAQQLVNLGFMPEDAGFEVNNPCAAIHAQQLEELGIS